MSKYYDRVDEATYLFVDEPKDQNGDKKQGKRNPPQLLTMVEKAYKSRWVSIRLMYMLTFMNYISYTATLAFLKPPPLLTMAEKAYKSRWVSIRLMYMMTFMNYISYTATLASLWAYLKVLDPEAQATTMGWVVSAYAMGQIVSGPFFGFWSNRRSVKEALVVSLLLNLLAYIFYMYLASLPSHRGYYMVAARWLIGFGSASIPLSRTYVANATSLSERTPAIANSNICGALGFILGPLVQTALVPISYPGLVESRAFHFNMYTAPILLSALITFTTLAVVIFAFTEHSVEDDTIPTDGDPAAANMHPSHRDATGVDYTAAVSCVVLFFCSLFNLAFMETIIVPLIMHMFAWSKTSATLFQSVGIGGTALLSIVVYIFIKWLAKRVQERIIFLLGFVILVLAYIIILPWGRHYPRVAMADIEVKSFPTTIQPPPIMAFVFVNNNDTASLLSLYSPPDLDVPHSSHSPSLSPYIPSWLHFYPRLLPLPPQQSSSTSATNHTTTTTHLGCPWQYSWCQTVPAIRLVQLLICLVLFGIGYPITNLLTISIFSKTLGPKQMGLWMGILIASGCLAGIVSPVLQTKLYENFGPRVTFIAVAAFMGATCLLILGIFRRLGPPQHTQSMDINNKG